MAKRKDRPTEETYDSLQRAFDFFNQELFAGKLPQCLITIKTLKGAHGYFAAGRFKLKRGKARTDEITLSAASIDRCTEERLASTLLHEMVHMWQYHDPNGDPGRRGYHNRQWADKMEEVGLRPSSTGKPGGDRTGDRMTHYIVRNGAFQVAWRKLKASSGYRVVWADPAQPAAPSAQTRMRYACPQCDQLAWAKATASLKCGYCNTEMLATL